ncbi:hypothetical protein [Nocardia sp. NPDC050435]|uniref:hypothetical protein n=1 Tax=Nocardia sp. NPDC050435 TaxID=3155040 RepID=UPI0033CA3AC6
MDEAPTEPIAIIGTDNNRVEVLQAQLFSVPRQQPDRQPDPKWQAELLRRIQHWAAEHTRLTALGADGYDGTDIGPTQEWAAQLDAVQAQLDTAEELALESGLEPAWIEDIRELGHRTDPMTRMPESAPATTPAATAYQQFMADKMSVDVWHLQRMSFLVAAYQDRVATGRSSITFTPAQLGRFGNRMLAHHERASALARGAGITAAEGERWWGPSPAGWQALHISYVSAHDEMGLVGEMRRYMTDDPAATLPPGVADFEARTGAQAGPPPPEAMIADAYAAIRAHFIDHAVADLEGGRAAAEAIESALPAAELADRSATSTHTDLTVQGATPELGAGPGP